MTVCAACGELTLDPSGLCDWCLDELRLVVEGDDEPYDPYGEPRRG